MSSDVLRNKIIALSLRSRKVCLDTEISNGVLGNKNNNAILSVEKSVYRHRNIE